jgi:branched-chain amino acid transport system ATP-binding protein
VVLLDIEEVVIRFGGVTALDGPSFGVPAGGICGLIGPNGAGKTTLFNCVSRLYEPESGRIAFDGQDLLARDPHEISALGIARTFQNLGLFASMTVRDNVALGAYGRMRPGFVATALRPNGNCAARRTRSWNASPSTTYPTIPRKGSPTGRSSASSSPGHCFSGRDW